MLTVISGTLGAGKTLFLTILGKDVINQGKRGVIANYHLKYDYQEFSMYKFVQGSYDNAIVLIDEAYTLLESRNFMSSENQAMSYVLFQSRKKSLEMVLTVQLNSTLDLRFRDLADLFIRAEGLVKKKNGIYYKYILFPRGKKQRTIYLNIEGAFPFYDLYDTNEIIEPIKKDKLLTEILQPEEKMEKVNEYVQKILKENANIRITKGTIKLWLFKNRAPESLMPYVYEEIRQFREAEKQAQKEMGM